MSILDILTKWQPLSFFVSAVATIGVALVAIFQDRLRRLFFSAKLDLEQGPFYPDLNILPLTNERTGEFLAEARYLQIRVKNDGPSQAEKVEVFVANLEREIDGVFREVNGFYPLNLKWRHYDSVFLERLSPKTARDCTLGRLVDPERKKVVGDDHPSLRLPPNRSPFRLELAVTPNTRSDLLEPGKYRLFLEICASNTRRPKKRTLELEFSGEWLPQDTEMATARRA